MSEAQHLQLARDLNILMLDGSVKLKDQWLLPAGVLREPIAACRRANILIVTRKAERPVQLLTLTGAAADHPVALEAPEGAYLKVAWLRIGDPNA